MKNKKYSKSIFMKYVVFDYFVGIAGAVVFGLFLSGVIHVPDWFTLLVVQVVLGVPCAFLIAGVLITMNRKDRIQVEISNNILMYNIDEVHEYLKIRRMAKIFSPSFALKCLIDGSY